MGEIRCDQKEKSTIFNGAVAKRKGYVVDGLTRLFTDGFGCIYAAPAFDLTRQRIKLIN